jgi:hypothetical protein
MITPAVVLTLAACGSGPAQPSAPSPTASVTDPIGDAVPRPSVALSPDLTAATATVADGALTITVSFAPGTFSQSDTLTSITLDVDENPASGSPGIDSGATDRSQMGTDYVINAVAPRGSTQAVVLRAVGNVYQFVPAGAAAVTFPASNQMRVTVPLSVLGNDDGRMKFKVTAAQYLSDTTTTGITDFMPDAGLAPAAIR